MSVGSGSKIIWRDATAGDAADIAALHVAVWRHTYRDLAPKAAYDQLDEPLRRARWTALLDDPAPGQFVHLAIVQDRLAGFGMLMPSDQPAFAGRHEIKFLYVSDQHRRLGIGRQLMRAMAREALRQGAPGVALGVVEGNQPAIAFYERLGGTHVGRYTDAGPLWRSVNLVYAWDDLSSL